MKKEINRTENENKKEKLLRKFEIKFKIHWKGR